LLDKQAESLEERKLYAKQRKIRRSDRRKGKHRKEKILMAQWHL